MNGLKAARMPGRRAPVAARTEGKFQKKKRWADREAMWEEIVICAEDVRAAAESGAFDAWPGDAFIGYLDRGTCRALRDKGYTKDEIAEAWIMAERVSLEGLPVLGGEQG